MKSLLEKIKNFLRPKPENAYSYTFKEEPPSEEVPSSGRYEYIPMPLGDFKSAPEVDLSSMTRAELLNLAVEKGVKVSKKAKKQDIINRISELKNS